MENLKKSDTGLVPYKCIFKHQKSTEYLPTLIQYINAKHWCTKNMHQCFNITSYFCLYSNAICELFFIHVFFFSVDARDRRAPHRPPSRSASRSPQPPEPPPSAFPADLQDSQPVNSHRRHSHDRSLYGAGDITTGWGAGRGGHRGLWRVWGLMVTRWRRFFLWRLRGASRGSAGSGLEASSSKQSPPDAGWSPLGAVSGSRGKGRDVLTVSRGSIPFLLHICSHCPFWCPSLVLYIWLHQGSGHL